MCIPLALPESMVFGAAAVYELVHPCGMEGVRYCPVHLGGAGDKRSSFLAQAIWCIIAGYAAGTSCLKKYG